MFRDRVRGFYLHDTQPLGALQVWQEYRENEQMLDRIWDRLQVLPKFIEAILFEGNAYIMDGYTPYDVDG